MRPGACYNRLLFRRHQHSLFFKRRVHASVTAQRAYQAGSADTPRPEVGQADKLTDIGTRSIFTSDHDLFRTNVRRFINQYIVPHYDEWIEAQKVPREVWKLAGSHGLIGIDVPEKMGGHGGDFLSTAIVPEEQWYANCSAPALSMQSHVILPYFVKYGSPEQIARYVPALVAGTSVGCICMTEPGAGSDLQGVRTNATRDGSDWLLTGSKVFISHGIVADVAVVLARTDKTASPARGMSLFVVETSSPGFIKGRNLNKLGIKAEDTAELYFENIRLPASSLLGTENRGFHHIMEQLPLERLVVAIRAQAHCEWMFEEAREYVKQRAAFGRRIADLQTVQHRLAEMKTTICAGRAMTDRCIQIYSDTGAIQADLAAMAKYWTTQLQDKVATECLQLHGGWGYMMEYPIARAFVDARIQSIWGGTNEIMKEIIARRIT